MNPPRTPMFIDVCSMNLAFGNKPGFAEDFEPMADPIVPGATHYDEESWGRLQRQCENIAGRLGEPVNGEALELLQALRDRNPLKVRDALCDIMVFALGAYYFMGYSPEADMRAVHEGVMTRFCRTQEDIEVSVAKWRDLGVPADVFGRLPTAYIKASADCTSTAGEFIPKGKFLKPVGYREPVFPPAPILPRVSSTY